MKLLGGGKRKKVTAEVVPSPSTSKKSGVEEEGISPSPPLNVGPSLDEILASVTRVMTDARRGANQVKFVPRMKKR